MRAQRHYRFQFSIWFAAVLAVLGAGTTVAMPSIELSALDGSNGFAINGVAADDRSGSSVSGAGDINGDGLGDFVIGAPDADVNGSGSGQSYVVFGTEDGYPPSLELVELDGSNGFTINGIGSISDSAGQSVSGAGDVNGDGLDDLLIGAPRVDANGAYSGESYLVFGTDDGFSASLELADLDGNNGVAIKGIAADDWSGWSVSGAGDVNGDGLDDLLIGTPFATPDGIYHAGQSYVVFGRDDGFPATLELSELDGTNGFIINGIAERDYSGESVSGAGDVNGDGVDDLIIGAPAADPNGILDAGQSYVVFGRQSGFPASLELSDLDGSNGFAINGIGSVDVAGGSVSDAGDVNGDGLDDLLIGARVANPDVYPSGQTYVVFGSMEGFPASFELADLDGINGFTINGIAERDYSGESVSGAGDVNGDGLDDLVIGAPGADPNGDYSGQSYVVFGIGTVPTAADLVVMLSDAPDPVLLGSEFTYTIEVTNEGPGTAQDIEVDLQLPGGVTVRHIGDPEAECDTARREVECEIEGLVAHDRVVIAVTVLARRPGKLSATATVASEYTSDPDESNNTDSETTLVLRQ